MWRPNCGHIGLPAYHHSRFGGALGGPLIPKEVLGGQDILLLQL